MTAATNTKRTVKIEAPSHLLFHAMPFASVLVLAGCWTAPVAIVQPQGAPRLIQDAIAVTSVEDATVVSSVNLTTETIVLRTRERAETSTYKIGPKLSASNEIKAGDLVRATVTKELAVYVLRDDQPPAVAVKVTADARVLAVDPSYRLLTLQYPDGWNETFKVPLGTKLEQMAAGDSVVIRPLTVLALRRKG